MKTRHLHARRTLSAFTLIEMIGVLAVIAILAALLIPKIFEAINSSRINNAVVSYNTIKTAAMDHYGKFGRFDTIGGAGSISLPHSGFDTNVLLPEQLIDKAFQVKIGTNWNVQLRACENTSTPPDGANGAYALSGNTSTNETTGQLLLQCIIHGVSELDAIEISKRLDGDNLSATTPGGADLRGRVKYAAPTGQGAPVDVYMYIAHR